MSDSLVYSLLHTSWQLYLTLLFCIIPTDMSSDVQPCVFTFVWPDYSSQWSWNVCFSSTHSTPRTRRLFIQYGLPFKRGRAPWTPAWHSNVENHGTQLHGHARNKKTITTPPSHRVLAATALLWVVSIWTSLLYTTCTDTLPAEAERGLRGGLAVTQGADSARCDQADRLTCTPIWNCLRSVRCASVWFRVQSLFFSWCCIQDAAQPATTSKRSQHIIKHLLNGTIWYCICISQFALICFLLAFATRGS